MNICRTADTRKVGCETSSRIGRSDGSKTQEVDCDVCALDPVCRILEYDEGDIPLPPGILLRRKAVRRGGTLFKCGDPFQSIFAVKSGSFKTLVSSKKGGDRIIGFHLPGELMGAEALAGKYYGCTARALEPGSVCELRIQRLSETGRAVELLQQGVIELLGREVAFSHAISSSLIRQSAEQRLAAFFLNLSNRLSGRGIRCAGFMLYLSRRDTASYLGLASETVSRLLGQFQKLGILTVKNRRICVIDVAFLERLAGHP